MTLQFPTQAEKALAKFQSANKTTSLAKIAKRMGADVVKKWPTTTYYFDDDTSLEVTGRGRAHRVEARLP